MKRIIKGVLAAALVATALTAGTISFAANTEVSAIEGVTATLTGSLDDSNFAYYGVGKTNKNIESTTANISSDGEYVISWTVSGNASTVDYLYLDLNFPSPINTQPIKDTFPNLNIVVTEVKTGSTIVDYKMGTNSVNYDYLNGGLDSVRVTLCDQSTANNGYLSKRTAIGQTLSVTFQVSGLGDDTTTTPVTTTTMPVQTTPIQTTMATTLPVTQPATPVVTTTAVVAAGSSSTGGIPTPTQTADLSVGAIVIGGVAAVSLAGAAFTVTRRKKK